MLGGAAKRAYKEMLLAKIDSLATDVKALASKNEEVFESGLCTI